MFVLDGTYPNRNRFGKRVAVVFFSNIIPHDRSNKIGGRKRGGLRDCDSTRKFYRPKLIAYNHFESQVLSNRVLSWQKIY